MIELYDFLEDGYLGVKFGGENFDEFLMSAKLCGGKFQKEGYKDSPRNIWLFGKLEAREAVPMLHHIEKFEIPQKLEDWVALKPETKFFRRKFKKDLLMSPPMGEFQLEGLKKGISQNRLYYAWEMGLGKTWTAVNILNHLIDDGSIDRVLIVTPPESLYNFRRELLKFNSWGLAKDNIYVANVNNREPLSADPEVIMMTYRTFMMLSDDAYKKKNGKRSTQYRKPPLDFSSWGKSRAIICDEAHKFKNPTSRTYKVLSLHKHFFDYRYLLSGTPDPNGVEGYYSQVTFMDEEIIGRNYYRWLESVADLGTRFSKYAIARYNPDGIRDFIKQISPWFDRQFTKDNLDLPDLLVKPIYFPFTEKQRTIYRDTVEYILYVLKEKEGRVEPKMVVENFPFIMQAIDNPSLLKGKIDPAFSSTLAKEVDKWKFKEHSALEYTNSLLESYIDEEKRKVILWTGHPLTANQLRDYYKKYNPIVIHGQIDIPKNMEKTEYRNQLLEDFKTDAKRPLLIASYKVLSSAVNIVESTRSIYFDRSWSYEDWAQSIKRNHRIGQTSSVVVNPLVVEDSLSMRLHAALEKKENINRNLFNYSSLNQQQWKSIFLGELDY